MDDAERVRLGRAIAEAALLRGRFVLRSGRTSGWYLDKYRFSTRPELLAPLCELLGEAVAAMESGLGRTADRLAGAELGGIPLVTGVSLRTGRPSVFVRNERKGYGTGNRIEGVLEAGDGVILIEDVATSGGQALEAVSAVCDAGARALGVVAVIDREEGARERISGEGVVFDALFTKRDLGIGAA